MKLSIVIPAYNESELLGNTIQRIKEAISFTDLKEWELIVCDNNSTDNTSSIAKENGAQVITESVQQIARARNKGGSIASGEWLLFIDADTYPSPHLLNQVLSNIDSKKIIGCGSTVEVINGSHWNKLRMERLNLLMRWGNWCGGAFLLTETKAFNEIGGFSDGLYAFEEIDFVRRLKRYGKKQGKKFTVLYKYPVFTSGRKGALTFTDFWNVFIGMTLATCFFLLYYLLPKRYRIKNVQGLLRFWYGRR